jgi:hypothetical protein
MKSPAQTPHLTPAIDNFPPIAGGLSPPDPRWVAATSRTASTATARTTRRCGRGGPSRCGPERRSAGAAASRFPPMSRGIWATTTRVRLATAARSIAAATGRRSLGCWRRPAARPSRSRLTTVGSSSIRWSARSAGVATPPRETRPRAGHGIGMAASTRGARRAASGARRATARSGRRWRSEGAAHPGGTPRAAGSRTPDTRAQLGASPTDPTLLPPRRY